MPQTTECKAINYALYTELKPCTIADKTLVMPCKLAASKRGDIGAEELQPLKLAGDWKIRKQINSS